MDQVNGTGNVGIDDPPRFLEVLIQKRMAEAAPRIRQKGINLTTLRSCIQLVHAFGRGQIRLECLDLGSTFKKGCRRPLDLGFVGRNQKVVALLRAPLGKFKSYACRRTGDDRKKSRIGHVWSPALELVLQLIQLSA